MFTEDLDPFFDTDDFAETATINTTLPRVISVIRSTPTEEVALYEGSVEAGAPFLRCKTSDTTGIRDGNTATIAGIVYRIKTIRHDGAGTSRLILKT